MLFLFNDVLLEIPRLSDVLNDGRFPLSEQQFEKMTSGQIMRMAREEVFEVLDLPQRNPKVAMHLAVLLAAKTRANAVLIAPPVEGARKPEELGVRLAEVSLVTMSNLYQKQKAGTLSPREVSEQVWMTLPMS